MPDSSRPRKPAGTIPPHPQQRPDAEQGIPADDDQVADNPEKFQPVPPVEFQQFHSSKLIFSSSIASGLFLTCVQIAPIYSPMTPMKINWTAEKKNSPITRGAKPS